MDGVLTIIVEDEPTLCALISEGLGEDRSVQATMGAICRAIIQYRVDTEEREHSFTMQVGMRLRKVREAMGLTQKVVAERAGISMSMISQFELGRIAPSLATLLRLASAVGVKPAELLADV